MDAMVSRIVKGAVALGIAGTFAVATPVFAAPVMSSGAAVKAAAPVQTTDVRWRGGGWHGGWRGGGGFRGAAPFVGGLALGLAGAALAAPYYGYGYDSGPYYYSDPGYVVVQPGYAVTPGPYWGGGYRYYPGW
jgi:hypothetical protein